MKKSDWIGLGTSVALHAALLFLFTFLTAANVDTPQIGFVEVEFGPFAEGRPARPLVDERPDPIEEQANEPEAPEEPVEQPPAPEESRQVDLPDQSEQILDEERVESPTVYPISPEEQNVDEAIDVVDPEPEPPPIRPLGSGALEGLQGNQSGSGGQGTEEEQAAPFEIEGLNRDGVYAPLPRYEENADATIRVRITVDPQGRVTSLFPLLKGDPVLEQATMDALRRWRFNPLPPNAPQELQTGVVTFRFRRE